MFRFFPDCSSLSNKPKSNHSNAEVDLNQLRMQSAIYSLDPGDKLKDYLKAINDACFGMAKENLSLVHDKK